MKCTLTSATALVAGLAPLSAAAQDTFLLDEITASANLQATEIERSGSTVTVVTEDELRAAGDARLTDYLARLPGVTITPNGPVGARTGLSLRGASQNYVAVRIDGIEVNDPSLTQVAYDFGGLTTADISRIEVLKGSQSALYGSSAIGGVIDITTRRATEIGTEQSVAIEAGSYDTLRASYGLATRTENAELAFTLSHIYTGGFSAADENDGNTEEDGYRASRLSVYGHRDFDNGLRLGFSAFAEESRGEYDPQFYADPTRSFSVALGDGETYDEVAKVDKRGLRVFAEFATGAVEHEVSASVYEIERRYQDGETFLSYDPVTYAVSGSYYASSATRYTGTRTKLRYQGTLALGLDSRLSFGADTEREAYDQTGTYGDLDADSHTSGVFAELAWAPSERLDVTLAARHDDHSEFGGQTTGRVAVAFRPVDDLTIRGALGTGYRAPSLYELNSFYGDPTLEPEESLTAELGVEKRFGDRASLRATAFYLEVDDLIDYSFATSSYAQVSGTSRRSGVELEGAYSLGDRAVLSAAYTYIDSSTNASASWSSVPRHTVSLGLEADIAHNLSGGLTALYAADRDGLDDFAVVNGTIRYQVAENTEAYLRVENLFDEQYQYVSGYGTSDRAVYVGLRQNF
ncbi:vitamin B12 transporter [Rhodovulum iodosum]|uniref:Vitamin B12 transporter n=1 Tax=Rhodovulum iodosum TaxID=68291 RepID=A0ABV3XPE6_9RHOB|nr:TonB-dependent receptor [Rhodovulum robiginosum]RSK35798.1 TonB-dependent receptor [Rhodovulum robiginosum]